MNIMTLAMSYLGPTVVSKIASRLGIQSPMVTKLIMAALPTLLAGMTKKASSGSGAGGLFDMIKDAAFGKDDLEARLDGPDADGFLQSGSDALSGMLGGSDMDALNSALQNYGDGANASQTQSLLSMLGPVAMGALNGQVSKDGMDAGGLATFLNGQKDNIASAIPAGFADHLEGTGLLDAIQPAAAASIPEPKAPPRPAPAPAKSGGMMKWIIGAIVLAGLAWYFLGGSKPEMADLPTGADFSVGDVNLSEKFTGVTEGLTSTFGGITDTASAEAALPQLESFNTELGEIGTMAGELPDQAKGAFGGIIGTALSTLKPMIDNAIESSGAGAILQPIADKLLGQLETMSQG